MRRAVILAAAILFLAGVAAWASGIRMTGSPVVPSAAGNIDLDHDHNGNTVLKIKVEHLAQPTSLAPPKSVYAVWVQPPDREPELAGELKTGKDLKGSFETSTPYKNFDVFITAEDTAHPQQPSGPVVLRASVQQ